MERADKKRNRLLLVKHIHTHTTENNSVKLTVYCWQWREQIRRETGYYWSNIHTHNTIRPFSKTHQLMLEMERTDKERNRLLLVKHTHMYNTRPFSKTHSLMLAMDRDSRQEEKPVTSGQAYTHAQHETIQ